MRLSLSRFDSAYGISSNLNPIEDVSTLVGSLLAEDYLIEVVSANHGLTKAQAKSRSKQIIPHIAIALDYLDSALSSSRDTAFLPTYYAALNLLKVYVLLGPLHRQLSSQRWHGATYDVNAKDSRNVMTEYVTLKSGGAIPLFYQTLTQTAYPNDSKLKLREILPYVTSVGAEYHLLEGRHSEVASVTFSEGKDAGNIPCALAQVDPIDPDATVSKQRLKLLSSAWKKVPGTPGLYSCTPNPGGQNITSGFIDQNILRSLLYSVGYHSSHTPLCGKQVLMPQELPIFLLFFYLSSITRYKPEFLAKVKDSRHWPILKASRKHALLDLLMLFWSHLHNTRIEISRM